MLAPVSPGSPMHAAQGQGPELEPVHGAAAGPTQLDGYATVRNSLPKHRRSGVHRMITMLCPSDIQVFTNDKAGMQGVDKNYVKRVVSIALSTCGVLQLCGLLHRLTN